MSLNIPAFLQSVEIMLIGMIGIFIVTVAIILTIRILNGLSSKKSDK